MDLIDGLPGRDVEVLLRYGLQKRMQGFFFAVPGFCTRVGCYHNHPIFRNFIQAYFYSF